MEQAFVHRAAVGARGIENLATALQPVTQAFARQHHPLRAGEPEVLTDAPAFDNEKPAIDLRARRSGEQPAAQGQVLNFAGFGNPAEFEPRIAHAPIMAPEQQVPRHLLAGITIGFDSR